MIPPRTHHHRTDKDKKSATTAFGMVFSPSAHQGIAHRYTRRLFAFEHANPTSGDSPHTLLWVGGLGDGLLTVLYPTILAQRLPAGWCLAEVLLTSSYDGWGLGSLKRDARDLAQCVQYFRNLRPASKLVIMGHSTGCQDIMEYLVGEEGHGRPKVDGAILQASISDREALVGTLNPEVYDECVKLARQWIDEGREDDVLPSSSKGNIFGGPVTAKRWLSLASPDKNGDDDYFSSDLELDQLRRTFGAMKRETPLMFLYSGADEHVPSFVDKETLLAKWTAIIKDGGGVVDEKHGGVLPGAHHNLNGDPKEVVDDLVQRVDGFLNNVARDGYKSSANL